MRIFLDTNFLIYCIQQKIPFIEQLDEKIHERYEIIVLDSIMNELEIIKKRKKTREKWTAKIALEMIKKSKSIKVIKGKGKNADDSLVLFDFKDVIIASLDRELRKRFKNARFLTIKRKKYLDFV